MFIGCIVTLIGAQHVRNEMVAIAARVVVGAPHRHHFWRATELNTGESGEAAPALRAIAQVSPFYTRATVRGAVTARAHRHDHHLGKRSIQLIGHRSSLIREV